MKMKGRRGRRGGGGGGGDNISINIFTKFFNL